MREPIIGAVDQGTGSTRVLLYDSKGRTLARAQRTLHTTFPHAGWVEQDPEELWEATLACMREVMAAAGVTPDVLTAVGLANQTESFLLWDRRNGRAVTPVINWQCRRGAAICDRLRAGGHAETIRVATGLPLDATFSAPKVRWALDQLPEARRLAARDALAFGTLDSWLLWRLSGGRIYVTDASNAARTMLFNIRTQRWDKALLSLFDLPASLLAAVRDSSEVYGVCSRQIFGAEIPLAGAAGDQSCALLGLGCVYPGMAKVTYGTGAFIWINTGPEPQFLDPGLVTTVAWRLNGMATYALEGFIISAGAIVRWLTDALGILRSPEESADLAAAVPDTGGVLFVPALAGLGSPYWDAKVRGGFLGLSLATGRGHLTRAVLEAITYRVREVIGVLGEGNPLTPQVLRVDGAVSRNDFLLQLQADTLRIPVERAVRQESTSLGAAILAGLALGVWANVQEAAELWQADRIFCPHAARESVESRYRHWQRTVNLVRTLAETSG